MVFYSLFHAALHTISQEIIERGNNDAASPTLSAENMPFVFRGRQIVIMQIFAETMTHHGRATCSYVETVFSIFAIKWTPSARQKVYFINK